jgi:hypothetical protein
VLETRFGDILYELREEVRAIRDETVLQRLLREAIVAPSLAAFEEQLRATPG